MKKRMELIDGKLVSSVIKNEIKEEIESVIEKTGCSSPTLSAILVGDNPASQIYVRNKERACNVCGIVSSVIRLPETITQNELNAEIDKAAHCSDGVIVQLPLPNGLNSDAMEKYWEKDVDGFTTRNLGMLIQGKICYYPATPGGILELLKYYKIETEGKNVLIIGRSDIVGKPMAALLMNRPYSANVTVCHSKTNTDDLRRYFRDADIVIVAIGKPKYITEDFFEGTTNDKVIIDVGINRIEDKSVPNGTKVVGDVDYENIKKYCSFITPVPGGVGPMTVAMLMKNTLKSWKHGLGISEDTDR